MSIFNRKKSENIEHDISVVVTEVTEETAPKTIGARISEARKTLGYTQEEFSQMLDVTAQAVSKWENDISCPDIQLLPKIADILGMTTDELLTGKKAQSEKQESSADAVNIYTSNLKININVSKPGQKPINVSLPLAMVKKFAKIGNGISGILGNGEIEGVKLDEILQLVENGATGEILNVVAEDDTVVSINIQ